MLAARRRIWIAVVVVALLASAGAYTWAALGEASALSTSYSRIVAHRQSLSLDAYELLSGVLLFRRTADRLVAAKHTHGERLAALMEWAHENVRPQFAAPKRLVADSSIDIARRGYGYCDQTAHVFATLARFAGYDVHLLFLRALDGVTPHTVAEVRVDDRWVLVDAWLGILFRDGAGRLAGTADLGKSMTLPPEYALLRTGVDEGHFRRGTPFETFPYLSWWATLDKVRRGIVRAVTVSTSPPPAATPATPATTRATTRPAPDPAPAPAPAAGPAEIIRMDEARRAHLEGRYEEAIAGYRGLLLQPIPADMGESIRFFLGLALLRGGAVKPAVLAFDSALEAAPETAWRPSILYYRSEAKLQRGDIDGAVRDLRAADIPPANRRLADLRR